MGISVNEIVTGRKTFFILPDTSLMPPSYLEDLFALGFECYYISHDTRIKTEKKIETILSLFKDVILYINIDYELPDVNWNSLIYDLVQGQGKGDSIGIMYAKRQSRGEKEKIEHHFINEIGIKCGCIQLEYQKKQNFELIAKALYANQAQGRRKAIRAICSPACTYTIYNKQKQETISGALQDISLSHFTILVQEGDLQIKLYEKILDIHFNLKGFFFRSDAVLFVERKLDKGILYVFAFTDPAGASGLDYKTKAFLVPHLYKMVSSYSNALLEQSYKTPPLTSASGESIPAIKEVEGE